MQDAAVRVQQADRFEVLYRDHGDRLWRSLLLATGDRDIASDAVAEAFAQAIRRGDRIESELAWVTHAAYRIAAGELKARRRRAEGQPSERAYEMREPLWELMQALSKLSPKQRAAAVLHFRDGYTMSEVAEIIGSTTAAVGVHLHRARRRLRQLLEGSDG
jgi:RNA polymerase sigma-70 factor (ECF subfamily)